MYKYIVPSEMDGHFVTECLDSYLNLDKSTKSKKRNRKTFRHFLYIFSTTHD